MSFTTIIVTGRYSNATTGAPVSGTVTLTRGTTLRDTTTGEIVLPDTETGYLDSAGLLRLPVVATTDPSTTPSGTLYTVTEAIGGATRTYTTAVPYNQAEGVLDLASVAPARASEAWVLSATRMTGGGAVAAPLTLSGTDPMQAPLSVVQTDTGTNTAPNVMALTHSLSSGTAAAGMGAGLAFRLQRDDDVVHLAAALVAVWTDPGGLGELRVPVYDDTTPYTLRWMPSGLFVPNASAEPALPINGGVLYVESGAFKYKGSSGTVTTLGPA
jgi:hypothetical protein